MESDKNDTPRVVGIEFRFVDIMAAIGTSKTGTRLYMPLLLFDLIVTSTFSGYPWDGDRDRYEYDTYCTATYECGCIHTVHSTYPYSLNTERRVRETFSKIDVMILYSRETIPSYSQGPAGNLPPRWVERCGK
jgi:hypothetical protein